MGIVRAGTTEGKGKRDTLKTKTHKCILIYYYFQFSDMGLEFIRF